MPSILDTVKPLIDRGVGLGVGAARRVPFLGGAIPKPLNDQTIKHKVESTLYRVPGVSRSKVKVTVADGIATVHGEARNQAQMASIETTVRGVPEVRGYESQLHLPKTPAPSTPRAGQKQAKKSKPAAGTRAASRGRTERVNRDKTTSPEADPKPTELAAKREGRKAAPMGSKDPDGEGGGTPSTSTSPAPGRQADSPAADVTSGSKADS